jgi:hypothetical protein
MKAARAVVGATAPLKFLDRERQRPDTAKAARQQSSNFPVDVTK